jgi:hypothetical protein
LITSQEEVKFHSDPTITWVIASRHAGRTALSVGGSTAIPVPLMWNPAIKRPCFVWVFLTWNRKLEVGVLEMHTWVIASLKASKVWFRRSSLWKTLRGSRREAVLTTSAPTYSWGKASIQASWLELHVS